MTNQEVIVNQEVVVNQQLQEQIQYKDPEFPLARFIDQLDHFADGGFLCHWHTEFELAIVLQGNVEYQLDQQPFHLSAGEGIFISSQVLHSAHQLSPGSMIFNIEFPPTLFNTVGTSSLYQKYFRPISMRKHIGYQITRETEEGVQILSCLQRMHDSEQGKFAYELICMQEILHIWRNLLTLISHSDTAPPTPSDLLREHRTRKMVAFIQMHFASPITVDDIAGSANISRSECFRCFSLFCRIAPMEYVNRYRLQYAAQKLTQTSECISDVCFSCGFSSTSYFGKAFRAAYGLSPSSFRKEGTQFEREDAFIQ